MALLVLGGAPAAAQPAPGVGQAIGDAGTAVAVVRMLPNTAPNRPLPPDAQDKLPRQTAAEVGIGLSSAQVNSESGLAFERAVAQASPAGTNNPNQHLPGSLAQTAPPDNAQPATSGLRMPSTALDALVTGGALTGSTHARWSDTAGPCVDVIAASSMELASLSALSAIPTLPGVSDLSGVLDVPDLDPAGDQTVVDGLRNLAGPLRTLGGVLAGQGNTRADGAGSLLSLPGALSVRSTVRLVDLPGATGKAIQSTSTLQVAAVTLLAGTPFAITVTVVSPPTLQVTSTGDAATSTVSYTAPVLDVSQGGTLVRRLDAANPTVDLPIAVPLPAAPGALPIIGGQRAAEPGTRLDLGVLRLGIGQLNQQSQPMTEPYRGFQLGAAARLLDVQVLPTAALGLPNLPSALAQVTVGEQVARAYAPDGGVRCGSRPAAPPVPNPQGTTPPLAYTNAQYKAVPIFWTGTAMLLVGAVLVAAFPTRRTPLGASVSRYGGWRASPRPRSSA